jgi:predicted ATPase/class 3 adenylate cyclase
VGFEPTLALARPLFESGTINHSDTSPPESLAKGVPGSTRACDHQRRMRLPIGPTVTFLFTDIEGSTRLERAVGSAAWAALVARHDALLRAAIESAGGVVVKTEGDAFFAAFGEPTDALRAAVAAQRSLASEAWPEGSAIRVRMGLHLGEGRLRDGQGPADIEDYVGIDVNYAARLAAAANGRQVVVSDALAAAIPPLPTVPGLGAAELRLDGLRAVKDFDDPLPVYRLLVPGAADDPRPLRTTEAPSNLPGDVTTFIGRDDEVERVGDQLRESRVVTLTGPGGSGKTRLALATARSVRERFPHGVWFVDLAAVQDAGQLEPSIAGTLGIRESADRTVDEAVRAHLRDRSTLLVLDNLEQLLPAVAGRVAELVRGAPELRVLATSREVLRISGEHQHRVPPLEVEAGVSLFIDRARATRPDLVLDDAAMGSVRAISERLGGLPLALELAAARVRVLSPGQILERLERSLDLGGGPRDLPERQRTLRGAIAWSHALLSTEERRLFARLGVFADGWTAAGALSVADGDGTLGMDVLEGLESLVDKSLVRVDVPDVGGEARFGFHRLLREYALERLDEAGERDAADGRFVALCVEIAAAAQARMLGPDAPAWLGRLDAEDHNLRAAVDWSLAHGEPESGLRIVGAIWRWFHQRGRLREGRALLEDLLRRPEPVDPRVRLAALAALGGLSYWLDDFPAARVAYEERLTLAEPTGDPAVLAEAHYDLGFIALVEDRAADLRMHEQRAVDLFTEAGDLESVVRARQALTIGTFLTGDYAAAAALSAIDLEMFRARGSELQIADTLTLMTALAWRSGDLTGCWAYLQESRELFATRDSASGLARVLGMAAIILLSESEPEVGARLAGATYRLVREKGVMLAPVRVLHLPDPAALATERLGKARTDELLAEGAAMDLEEALALLAATPAPVATA